MSYVALAQVYDELTTNVNYQQRARYIANQIKKHSPNGIVLDAGCGTGTLAFLLADKGYDVIGVDQSIDMLSIAQTKMPRFRKQPTLIHQDLRELDLYGSVGAVVCMQDTFNHFGPSLNEILSRFALFTDPSGLLICDINTLYKHQEILADNAFVYEFDDGICVWQNHYQKMTGNVSLKVDVFLEQENCYSRETDEFVEYYIDEKQFEKTLGRYGYTILSKCDGESYGEVSFETQRVLYVAKKTANG